MAHSGSWPGMAPHAQAPGTLASCHGMTRDGMAWHGMAQRGLACHNLAQPGTAHIWLGTRLVAIERAEYPVWDTLVSVPAIVA